MTSLTRLFRPLDKVKQRLKREIAWTRVRNSMKVVHGPAMTHLAGDEVALVIVGRNMGFFLDHHIRHHQALGLRHVVYVDNGSTDESIEIVKSFPNTTIASCSANFRTYQGMIRYFANTRYLTGGWRLAIDPDELLDYTAADRIDLPELTRRLTARGHTALVAQMLEMVPEGPLSASRGMRFPEVERAFDRYSLGAITAKPYHGSDLSWAGMLERNETANPEVAILFGGLRKTVFDEDCCLTKHALFRMGDGVTPHPHPHVTTGVTCTDFTALLRHYKFAGGILERERRLLEENRVRHGETRLRVARLEEEGDIDLGRFAEHDGPTAEKLTDQGFLVTTDAAREMLG